MEWMELLRAVFSRGGALLACIALPPQRARLSRVPLNKKKPLYMYILPLTCKSSSRKGSAFGTPGGLPPGDAQFSEICSRPGAKVGWPDRFLRISMLKPGRPGIPRVGGVPVCMLRRQDSHKFCEGVFINVHAGVPASSL